jgi:ketosteroid isomerase-like protein
MSMSQENIDILQRAIAHFDATGEHLTEIYAPEFVCDMSNYPGWPEQAIYEGIEGLRRFLGDWGRVFDWEYEVESIHDAGEYVVFVARMKARGKETGLEFTWPAGHLWTLRDGKITRLAIYSDAAETLRDAGLPEAALPSS